MNAHGLDVSRVVMRQSENIAQGLSHIDILSERCPRSGCVTLCDVLWMKVPVLTLAGRALLGLIGTKLVSNLGLPDWAARSKDEDIGKAYALVA